MTVRSAVREAVRSNACRRVRLTREVQVKKRRREVRKAESFRRRKFRVERREVAVRRFERRVM